MLNRIQTLIRKLLDSPNMPSRRPVLRAHFESNIKDLYVIGDLAGASVVKLAMEQGSEVALHIAAQPGARSGDPGVYDLIVAGSGAAGLNAALVAQERGLRVLVLEKRKIANTIEEFPDGKWVYAEPDSHPPKGKLWLDGARKEDLIERWREIVRANNLEVRTEEGVTGIKRHPGGGFDVVTEKAKYRARRVVLATGQRGNPRRLGVPGEDSERVYHRLYSPKLYRNENILVVGGGNSAVEAALTLAEANRVTISYRGREFSRVFKDNAQKLGEAVSSGRIKVLFNSNVKEFRDRVCVLELRDSGSKTVAEVPFDHAFVQIGAEIPSDFLRSLGIRLENEWTGSRFAWLGVAFLIAYTIYGVKLGENLEFWPYHGWGYKALSFSGRPWSFWYTVLYTIIMTVFGVQAMKRWGFDRKDRFQIWRYTSLLSFQWIFFFLIPEFLFRWAVQYDWVGARLAQDPAFAGQAWRSYGIVYAWPLFFYTFFGSPHQIWVVWGVILSFVLIPVLALFQGKRYCSWVCGCGGLAETLGDRWRHLAPKGKASIRWERMNSVVLLAAAAVTGMVLLRDMVDVFRTPGDVGLRAYRLGVDVWLVGILPVTLYPFFGGKIWCRYWCPLAKMMELFSAAFTRLRMSRFAISANDKCIACGECSRNCQVGIDVMGFALKQDELNNRNSSCIGCGICVTVCPMNVLSFGPASKRASGLVGITSKKSGALV